MGKENGFEQAGMAVDRRAQQMKNRATPYLGIAVD
jgi:hypothetical protein